LIRPLIAYLREHVPLEERSRPLTAEEFIGRAQASIAGNCPAVVEQLLKTITTDRNRVGIFRQY